jgi:hypothetical protein
MYWAGWQLSHLIRMPSAVARATESLCKRTALFSFGTRAVQGHTPNVDRIFGIRLLRIFSLSHSVFVWGLPIIWHHGSVLMLRVFKFSWLSPKNLAFLDVSLRILKMRPVVSPNADNLYHITGYLSVFFPPFLWLSAWRCPYSVEEDGWLELNMCWFGTKYMVVFEWSSYIYLA